MSPFVFDAQVLTIILGGLTSLIFSYAPKLNTWFAGKPENYQKLFQLGLMLLITVFVFMAGCFTWLPLESFICDKVTALRFIYILALAIIGNQGIYKITPQVKEVAAIRVNRAVKDKVENEFIKG